MCLELGRRERVGGREGWKLGRVSNVPKPSLWRHGDPTSPSISNAVILLFYPAWDDLVLVMLCTVEKGGGRSHLLDCFLISYFLTLQRFGGFETAYVEFLGLYSSFSQFPYNDFSFYLQPCLLSLIDVSRGPPLA